ncbi:hypothetical protein BGZ47_000499 [Haplosporangium gracile]|nr:hypothetical protein BGZ47_000499 [Haplosporangium gracile]
MSTAIPSYTNLCLAADKVNNAVYLVGVAPAMQGRLEVNYISMVNINAPTLSPAGVQVNTRQCSSGAPKACFIHPLFALTGSVESFDWFLAITNDTVLPWAGVRLNFTDLSHDLLDDELTNFPARTPLIAVGTYSPVANLPSQRHSVVFDKTGQGQIYAASGSVTANMTKTITLLLSIKLTEEAVPVTMTITGYILDKAADGSTVVYSITPGTSTSLQRVDVKGGSPPFSKSYVATALNKQIITYSPSVSGNSKLDSFDTTTQTWSGPGLMNNGGGGGEGGRSLTTPEFSGTPIGAIIGGSARDLEVIALTTFFFVCHRRRGHQQQKYVATTESPEFGRYEDFNKANSGGASGLGGIQKINCKKCPICSRFSTTNLKFINEASSKLNFTSYGSPYISPNQNRVLTVSANASVATSTVTAPAVAAVATASSPEYIYAEFRASSYGGTSTPTTRDTYI